MADTYLNSTGLNYYHNRLKTIFASQNALDTLDSKVDDIISEGGEPNVIETVKVNGSALTPTNKAVNIDLSNYAEAANLPTHTSDLTNDGDGQSNFATEAYVADNGGKIDTISVNGTAQTITNKSVDITVPTAVSELTNDSGYQTATDVTTAISAAVASAYIYKGSVASQSALPQDANTGDVYDVQDTGMNYAWNGSSWDALGTYVDTSLYWAKSELSAITTAQIDALFV